jgi:hypothetical protein
VVLISFGSEDDPTFIFYKCPQPTCPDHFTKESFKHTKRKGLQTQEFVPNLVALCTKPQIAPMPLDLLCSDLF